MPTSSNFENKSIYYKKKHSLKGTVGDQCISSLEYYFRTGRIPEQYAKLNSTAKTKAKKQEMNKEHYKKFEVKVKGVDDTSDEWIKKIYDIEEDIDTSWFKAFEYIAECKEWNDNQMGLMAYSLIRDEHYEDNLTKSSFQIIKSELLKIKYPVENKRLFANKLESIKQKNYHSIKEYYTSILTEIRIFSVVYELSKAEIERRTEEIFLRGLGTYTDMELYKMDQVGFVILNDIRSVL